MQGEKGLPGEKGFRGVAGSDGAQGAEVNSECLAFSDYKYMLLVVVNHRVILALLDLKASQGCLEVRGQAGLKAQMYVVISFL